MLLLLLLLAAIPGLILPQHLYGTWQAVESRMEITGVWMGVEVGALAVGLERGDKGGGVGGGGDGNDDGASGLR